MITYAFMRVFRAHFCASFYGMAGDGTSKECKLFRGRIGLFLIRHKRNVSPTCFRRIKRWGIRFGNWSVSVQRAQTQYGDGKEPKIAPLNEAI